MVYADRGGTGVVAAVSASASCNAASDHHLVCLSVHVPVYCDSRGAIFPGMVTKSARTADRPLRGAAHDERALRAIALQQTCSALQLALCVAGRYRRYLLR